MELNELIVLFWIIAIIVLIWQYEKIRQFLITLALNQKELTLTFFTILFQGIASLFEITGLLLNGFILFIIFKYSIILKSYPFGTILLFLITFSSLNTIVVLGENLYLRLKKILTR